MANDTTNGSASRAEDRVLVTGANAGLGFEAARQLAASGVGRVLLACRSEEKALDAVERLAALTGRAADSFEIVRLDTGSIKSARAAATAVGGGITGVVLNAGGMVFGTGGERDGESHALNIHVVNVIGHAVFVEELIARNKLVPAATVVFAGSEAARGARAAGMSAPKGFRELAEAGDAKGLASELAGTTGRKYDQMRQYGVTKGVGALYMGALARRHADFTFLTVSPGMSRGTNVADEADWLTRLMFKYIAPVVMRLAGNVHSADVGAARYLSGLYDERIVSQSGAFFASPGTKLSGELVNQGHDYPFFDAPQAQDAAYTAVHSFIEA